MSLRNRHLPHGELRFGFSVVVYNSCNKRGQTSRSVVRVEIQTSCKRTYLIVVTFWIVATVCATMYLVKHVIAFWFAYVVVPICSVTSVVSYTKIFCTLRRHKKQVQGHVKNMQQSQKIPLNMARYRKAVSSALWVQLALVACYLPYGIVTAALNYSPLTASMFLAWEITATFVYFNSTLNPFLYCWKISEVKQAVKQIIREAFCYFKRTRVSS